MNRFYNKICRIEDFNRSLKAMERKVYTILIQKAAQNLLTTGLPFCQTIKGRLKMILKMIN